ncbi:MAG: hypothetical protein H6765_04575 [Candidatus Peribacteria bacterium]|nr:MAG: hypothetical protein H6765_04575 [Candidatus Peribacteria bacterium]
MKSNNKIYDVCLTMMEHPTIRDESGDRMDVWIIDTITELQQQLDAISAGK